MLKKYQTALLVGIAWLWPIISFAQVLEPPFGEPDTQQEPVLIVATVIQALLGLVGAATLLVFIWGGFKIIFSGGVEEKINKGRATLLWATIGLAIILSSYAILQYTFNIFKTATTT